MLRSRRARCYTTVSISLRAESHRPVWRIFVDWRTVLLPISMYTSVPYWIRRERY